MKQNWWILVIVILVLAFGLIEIPVKPSGFLRPLVGKWIGGLTEEARPTPTIQPDTPTLRSDEACALVYNYLENKITSMTVFSRRMQYLDTLSEARSDFQAVYQGNGKWIVAALGYWNLYEASGVIEPADDNARAWLRYIQQYTK